MKLIDNLLLVSHRYIAGIETSEEYKALEKKLKAANDIAKKVDNLKCCGNCNLIDCDTERGNLDDNFGKYCDLWCYDGQTTEDRRIK